MLSPLTSLKVWSRHWTLFYLFGNSMFYYYTMFYNNACKMAPHWYPLSLLSIFPRFPSPQYTFGLMGPGKDRWDPAKIDDTALEILDSSRVSHFLLLFHLPSLSISPVYFWIDGTRRSSMGPGERRKIIWRGGIWTADPHSPMLTARPLGIPSLLTSLCFL